MWDFASHHLPAQLAHLIAPAAWDAYPTLPWYAASNTMLHLFNLNVAVEARVSSCLYIAHNSP